jgi:cytoskeletal protein CcmA (bactofilin family)
MTTAASPEQITGSTDTNSNGGFFGTSTVNGISSLIADDVVAAQTAATNAAASATSAATSYDNFDDRYLGQKSSDPTLDNDGDALLTGALYFDTTNNVMKVYSGSAWQRTTPTSSDQTNINALSVSDVITDMNLLATTSNVNNMDTLADISSNITTVAGISGNVTTVAGISGNVTTVAGISSDVTTVAADGTDIGIVSTSIANVNTVAGISSNVTTVAGISSNVTSVASNSTNINTVAGDSTAINAVANDATDIGTVATNISNVNTVAGISANVTTVAGDTTNIGTIATNLNGTDTIGTVAGSISNVNTVGGSISNVNTVATDITNVNTVASNINSVNNFANQYRVASSAPTTSLDVGDLYFNTTTDEFNVYKSTGWTDILDDLNADNLASGTIPDARFPSVLPAISGANLTNLDATDLTGTIDSARIAGSYTGITGTGALNAGSITSGFGSIDTGSSNITTTGVGTFGSLDISGDVDVDGTLEADAITVNGLTLNSVIAGTTVNNATLASTVTVTDSTANTNFPVVFHNESNGLLDDTGALRYNPSTGELLVPNLTVAGTTTTVDTVTMEASNAIVFEGATADANETTLTIIDPTADRTISLPNESGTIVIKDGSGNVTIAGELSASSLDISNNVDIDGTLEADAITVNGATLSSVIQEEATALAIALG